MAERQELHDVHDKKRSELHSGRSKTGDERAAHLAGDAEEGRVNEARSEKGTPETAAHHSPDRRPGNNDNLGSGDARSHRSAPGGGKTRTDAEKR